MTSANYCYAFAFLAGTLTGVLCILLAICFRRKFFRAPFITLSARTKMVLHRGKWISIEEYLSTELGIPVSHVMTESDREEALRAFQEDVSHNGIPRPSTGGESKADK